MTDIILGDDTMKIFNVACQICLTHSISVAACKGNMCIHN